MEPITSPQNESIKRVARLARAKDRRESGLVLIEGPNLFAAAAASGARFDTILATEGDRITRQTAAEAGAHVMTVSDRVLASASDTKHPRSPVASIVRPSSSLPEDGARNVVVLVGLSDPGNAGTIIRTAASFGWGVAATPDTVDLWAPKTLRSGAGAHFSTVIAEGVDLKHVADGRTVVATVPSGGEPMLDGAEPYALLIGSEAHGLPQDALESAAHLLTIQTAKVVESLNASVAAGIAMYLLTGRT